MFAQMASSMAGDVVGGLFQLAGGAINNAFDAEQDRVNYERQKEFAQNSIRWKAEDAKKAGFHPLAALGSTSASYTPSASSGGMGIGDALANTGVALGRGVRKAIDPQEQQIKKLNSLKIRQEEVKTLAMERALMKMGQVPEPTQAMATPVKNNVPVKIKSSTKGSSAVHASKPALQLLEHGNGYMIAPSQEYADSADGMMGAQFDAMLQKHSNPEYWWSATHKLLPKPPKGEKFVLTRNFGSGWNWELVPENSSPGRGWFRYDGPGKKTRAKHKKGQSPVSHAVKLRRQKTRIKMKDGSYREL